MGNCCDSNHAVPEYSAQKRTHAQALKHTSMHSSDDKKPITLDKVMMEKEVQNIDQVQDDIKMVEVK